MFMYNLDGLYANREAFRQKLVVMMDKRVKVLALLSGGLDSTLAVKIMLEQGIDVEAVNFTTPFCL